MISVEHSGEIMQIMTLLNSALSSYFLFRRVANTYSLFQGNAPLNLPTDAGVASYFDDFAADPVKT